MREEFAALRGDMREGFAALRGDMAAARFDLLKWAFAFWVGQLAAVAGIVGAAYGLSASMKNSIIRS